MKFLAFLLTCISCLAQNVVIDADSRSSVCCPPFPAWSTYLTNFVVTNNAISGAAILSYSGCPHSISEDYDLIDRPFAPVVTGSNCFYFLDGIHNDLYAGRYTLEDCIAADTEMAKRAHADGFITIGATIAPSFQLSDTGVEENRHQFNIWKRSATNLFDIIADWDSILPQDTSLTNWYFDGTHFAPCAINVVASNFIYITSHFVTNQLSIIRSGNCVIISWPGYQMLQQSYDLTNFYDTGIRVGPVTNQINGTMFYRLKL